jgi:hypothetical protein
VLRGDDGAIDMDNLPARRLIHAYCVAIPQAIRPAV